MSLEGSRRTWRLTDDGDIDLNALKSPAYIDGSESIRQEMRTTLKTIQGEDPFDPEHGVPVFDLTHAEDTQIPPIITRALEREFSDVLDSVDAVTVGKDAKNRVATVEVTATLTNGDNVQVNIN